MIEPLHVHFHPARTSIGRAATRLMGRNSVRLAIAAVAGASLLAGILLSPGASARHPAPLMMTAHPAQVIRDGRPNIVFVLTDDLSMNLLRFMPHVLALQHYGVTFRDYFVSDSLCCPSRASIFTGNFPHDTGVYSNMGPRGGFKVFYDRGEENQTFANALTRAGYRTAMMGKYLNGYMDQVSVARDGTPANVPPNYVPPGWTRWDVAGYGYPEFNYVLNADGSLEFHGHQPASYLTDVLSRNGVDFINRSAAAGRPFFLELATFAPHLPATPAPRNARDLPGLQAPRSPAFNTLPTAAPSWLSKRRRLTRREVSRIDRIFRRRAQSVEAVDAMIGRIEQALTANGISNNTYIVFSSDNGFHTGEYRLMPGKLTAFDTDIRVPLVIAGPGVVPDSRTDAMTENIDLAKTFAEIAGTSMPGDGHSLLPLMLGASAVDWRNAVLIEHRGPHQAVNDPDYQNPASGNPWTYEAMRTHQFLYVEYAGGEREFYNLRSDPYELHNLAPLLSASTLARLHADLVAIENCHDGYSCWAAMHVAPMTLAFRKAHGHGRHAHGSHPGHHGRRSGH